MTVKELRELLATMPDEAEVRILEVRPEDGSQEYVRIYADEVWLTESVLHIG